MADTQLHQTTLGRKFFEQDIPRMVKALERIADALEKNTKLEESRFKQEKINESLRSKKDKEVLVKALREKYGDKFCDQFVEKNILDGK
jgi:hypothetical protein